MPIRDKQVSEITPEDIFDLVTRKVPEDAFLDLKRILFHPLRGPASDEQKSDLAMDFVAFANAQGGHIVVGVDEDEQHCARALTPMDGHQAEQVAKIGRDTAIARIAPPIQLQLQPLRISENEWIVVAYVPESQTKPHMWSYNNLMRFVIRDNDRKRTMTYPEIKEFFLNGPHEQQMARLFAEMQSLRSLFAELSTSVREGGKA